MHVMTRLLLGMSFALGLIGVGREVQARRLEYNTPFVFPEWASERDEQYIVLWNHCVDPRRFPAPVIRRVTPDVNSGFTHILEIVRPLGETCYTGEPDHLLAIRIPREMTQFNVTLGTRVGLAAGYVGVWPSNSNARIGYAYPALDSDGDGLVNGMEHVIGTNAFDNNSDDDGHFDGAEFPMVGVTTGDPCVGPTVTCQ